MPANLDETLAGRLERVAPRASKLLGTRALGVAADAAGSAGENAGRRVGPPGPEDERAIARRLRAAGTAGAGAIAREGTADEEADAIAADLVARARAVMNRLETGESSAALTTDDALALESVLLTRGRPALRVLGDQIESIDSDLHPGSGFWRIFLNDHESRLVQVSGATGAVVVHDRFAGTQPWVQGTAWLVADDLVVTNRHVLFPPSDGVRLAGRNPGKATTARFEKELTVTIDFAFDDGPQRQAVCAVVDVPYVAEDGDPIDVAVIRIARAALVAPMPKPLAPATAVFDSRQLYVVGHPGRMLQVPDKVQSVFGNPNERKRLSFGEVMDPEPHRPGEILHDASTIGGYSGGCVLGFRAIEVVALHYYGDPVTGNRAITAAALRNHAVARFF